MVPPFTLVSFPYLRQPYIDLYIPTGLYLIYIQAAADLEWKDPPTGYVEECLVLFHWYGPRDPDVIKE